jgi:hypothetical protein
MKVITARPIQQTEAAVVRNALLKAPLGPAAQLMLREVESLKVVGVCECGCRSIYFAPADKPDHRVAEGIGYLADGERVEVVVWASEGHLSSLELVGHAGKGQLPTADSICSWEEAGEREARTT